MTYPIWEAALQNPEISIVVSTCKGEIKVISTNRRRIPNSGAWTIDSSKEEIRFQLSSLEVLDFVRFITEQGYQEVRANAYDRLYRKAVV